MGVAGPRQRRAAGIHARVRSGHALAYATPEPGQEAGIDAYFERLGTDVEIDGHVGYYCAGMNQHATVRVRGNCGVGVAENMMSGTVIVEGSASQSAGATARGGLLVVHGDASARCGISLKGRTSSCADRSAI